MQAQVEGDSRISNSSYSSYKVVPESTIMVDDEEVEEVQEVEEGIDDLLEKFTSDLGKTQLGKRQHQFGLANSSSSSKGKRPVKTSTPPAKINHPGIFKTKQSLPAKMTLPTPAKIQTSTAKAFVSPSGKKK